MGVNDIGAYASDQAQGGEELCHQEYGYQEPETDGPFQLGRYATVIGQKLQCCGRVAKPMQRDAVHLFVSSCTRRVRRQYSDVEVIDQACAQLVDECGFGILRPTRKGRCKHEDTRLGCVSAHFGFRRTIRVGCIAAVNFSRDRGVARSNLFSQSGKLSA